MPKYVEGFVIPIPKKKFAAYKIMAAEGARVWKRFGALEYFECVGDDLRPKSQGGPKPIGFLKMAKATKAETVWFSFIVYKSKAHRDAVNKKVMAYFNKKYAKVKDFKMPFDQKKMAVGGFRVVIGK